MADARTVGELITQGAQKFVQDYSEAQRAVNQLTQSLQAQERIRTPQLAPAIAQINQALQQTRTSGAQFVQTLSQVEGATQRVTQVSNEKTKAIRGQSEAEGHAAKSGITYLSVLSAIHAASFLASNRTFTLLGSFVTLGLAFGKVSLGAGAVGLALGGMLFIFGQISNAAQVVQQAFVGLAGIMATVLAVMTTAAVAGGAAATKIAADVQSQFALIAAVEGATTAQLKALDETVSELAVTFGVSAKDVVAAASLFVRAGGDIEGAINGAAEAIIKLTVASAGELQAAEAARVVATGLRAFSEEGVTAEQVANAVAAAAQRSALSFTEVAQAFQQAVPGSVTLGITLSDLTAIITTLGNNALRGTVAGTSFKQFLLDLVNPSEKSAKVLNELGVSIVDSANNIRPIIDIIADLNEALSGLSQGDRAKKIAEIFESRAGLAGAILSRTTVDQLKALKSELDSLTVTNIVDVLLLPLNKQLERLGVTVSEVGRKFGEPLLEPLRAAVVTVINVLKEIIPFAQLAGQMIGVVLANQGFGALQTKITDLVGNNVLSAFLIELTNSFRNVRDVIVSSIIPAIQAVVSSFQDFGNTRLDQVGTTFDSINAAIQRVGAVIAAAIGAIGALTLEFIKNEGRGGELRTQILNIATAIAVNMVKSVATMTVFLTAATVAMVRFGEIALKVAANLNVALDVLAQHADNLGGAFEEGGLKVRKALLGAQVGTALTGGDIEGAQKLKQELREVEELLAKPVGPQKGTPLAQQLRTIQVATEDATKFSEELLRLLDPSAIEAKANETLQVFVDLAGDVPDALSNLQASIAQSQRELEQTARTTGAGTGTGIDEKEVQRASDRIKELAQDLTRKLSSLAEDVSTKTQNIVTKGLERIGDIYDKAAVDLQKLERDTNDRLKDIEENITQRRDDRGRTDALKDRLEDELRLEQKNIDDIERIEERALDNTRLARQRETEDTQRDLQEVVDAYERTYQRAQDAAERAFRNIQQTQEDALQRSQDAESKSLQLSLDAQSAARREQQQLSGAKTPEERQRVSAQIAAARADRQFEQNQQRQLEALKLSQQQRQRAFQQQQETQAIAFSQSQENKLLAFRKNNEKALLAERRRVEDVERGIRLSEENTQLEQRIGRENKLRDIRRAHELEIRNLQDTLENEAAHRQATRVIRDALDRAADIERAANVQAREIEETARQQLTQQLQDAERTIRGVAQSLDDLEESLPPDIFAAVFGQLAARRSELAEIARTITEGFAGPEGLRESALGELGREIGARELDLTSRMPSFTIPTLPVQVVPTQVINAGVVHVAQMTISRLTMGGLGQEFLSSLRQADQEGISLAQLDLGPVTGALNTTNNILDNVKRGLGR